MIVLFCHSQVTQNHEKLEWGMSVHELNFINPEPELKLIY